MLSELCEIVDLLTTESIRRNPFSSSSQLTHIIRSRSYCLTLTFYHHSVITRGYAILKGDYPAGMNEKYRIRRLLIGCVRLVYLVYVQYAGSCKPFPSRLERPIENCMHRAICLGPSINFRVNPSLRKLSIKISQRIRNTNENDSRFLA